MYYVMAEYRDEWGYMSMLRKGRLFKSYAGATKYAMKQRGVSEIHKYGGQKSVIVAAYRKEGNNVQRVA